MAEITTFQKKCPHGVPMRHIKKMSGASWYEPEDCAPCQEEERKKEEQNEREVDAFIDRIEQRQKRLISDAAEAEEKIPYEELEEHARKNQKP